MKTVEQQPDQSNRKERYNQFVLEALNQRPIRGRWPQLPHLMIQSLIAGRGIGIAWRGFWLYRRDEQGWKSFIKSAVPVMAYPIMVNSVLRRPGTKPSAGLVIMSFDELSQSEILDLVSRIEHEDVPSEEHRRFLSQLLNDESYQPNRRRMLPASITSGKIIYACDLWIPPLLLKNNCLELHHLPCLAEPGDKGRINVLPWWIAVGEEQPNDHEDFWQPGQIGVVTTL